MVVYYKFCGSVVDNGNFSTPE